MDKKIFIRIDDDRYGLLKQIFPNFSDSKAGATFVNEGLNLFKEIIKSLQIFSSEEVDDLYAIIKDWKMDFSEFPAKYQLQRRLEEYYKLKKMESFPGSFAQKIDDLNEYECYVLLRWTKGLIDDGKSIDGVGYYLVEGV